MGQQQLLLIVLGVIIVGIAVVVGMNVFTASSLSANNDALISDLQTIGAMAQQHYRKPAAMGGGGNTFDGSAANSTAFAIPPSLLQTANMSAAVVPVAAPQTLTLTATGTSKNATAGVNIAVVVTVTPDNITVTSTTVND
ncbi:MAG: hypothetical protein JEY94_09785 [Melioribacteraceae bacterium]|nr:hypothetical protein [Melioribacteraceae bacterium]